MAIRFRHTEAKTRRPRRKPLALPYATRPTIGPVRFDPSLHTAAELVLKAASLRGAA